MCVMATTHLSTGNHTYAVARGQESHEFLRDCFEPVWGDVVELLNNPVVCVDGTDYTLEVVCGSDYKVCTTLSTITYTCPSFMKVIVRTCYTPSSSF